MVNKLGDRLLGLFVPQATASAIDCGTTTACRRCKTPPGSTIRLWHNCTCWTNSNCTPYGCVPSTTYC
jgi:hypothetical protein